MQQKQQKGVRYSDVQRKYPYFGTQPFPAVFPWSRTAPLNKAAQSIQLFSNNSFKTVHYGQWRWCHPGWKPIITSATILLTGHDV